VRELLVKLSRVPARRNIDNSVLPSVETVISNQRKKRKRGKLNCSLGVWSSIFILVIALCGYAGLSIFWAASQ